MGHWKSSHQVVRFRPEWKGDDYCKMFGHTIKKFGDGPACRDCQANEIDCKESGILTKYPDGIEHESKKIFHNLVKVHGDTIFAENVEKYKIRDYEIVEESEEIGFAFILFNT